MALDTLYNDFNIMTASLLESGDKIIDQIKSILQSKKAKNISKQTIKVIRDLAIAFKDSIGLKKKVYKDKKYFYCHKLGYFGYDCHEPDRKLAKIGGSSIKRGTNNRSGSRILYQANQTIKNLKDFDDTELLVSEPVKKACMTKKQL